ncbi:hypothetical protein G8759_02700 [Spirosoma aureum]|uniref:Uncharacterized protein n=1 Tax=Spirosoma aureum TaxID=2692134 RepID=A0A6G9AH28_9BACT|nr:hypothetical protein [Spirosoma aureum]QIP11616.1 hypothetical protein G8759_02700 [Spirosoma aureum]
MATLTHSTTAYTHSQEANWITTYKNFVARSEFNRIGWAATFVAIQGCILSPALLLVMAYMGGGDWQFLVSNLCFLAVLIPVLSVLPMKYIFPSFAMSTVIHLAIILLDILS